MVLIILLFIIWGNTIAQKKQGVVFNSYNSIGFVAGKLPIGFTAQTENGIKIKGWFIGAGFGIDTYFAESMPLFTAVKKEFIFKKNSFFLYAAAGENLIVKNKTIVGTFTTVQRKGGFYGDAGVGYKIITAKNSSVYFSLGNTIKKQTESAFASDVFGMPGIYYTQYKFSRIAFKLGFQF